MYKDKSLFKIDAFGVQLKIIEHDDLLKFYQLRNKFEVRSNLSIQDEINFKHINFWYYKQLKSKFDYSYIVYYKENIIGYTSITNISFDKKICIGGLIIFDELYHNTGIAYNIAMCREIIIKKLSLNYLISKIYNKNYRSIKFCKSFGAKFLYKKNNELIFQSEHKDRLNNFYFISKLIKNTEEFNRLFGESNEVMS